jgi:hypothetical protein
MSLRDAAHPTLRAVGSIMEPARESASWLISQPEPRQFNAHRPRPWISRFRNPLVPIHAATLKGTRREAEITAQTTTVLELSIENLGGQDIRDLRSDSFELKQALNVLRRRDGGRRARFRGCVPRLVDLLQHCVDHDQALAMSVNLTRQPRG